MEHDPQTEPTADELRARLAELLEEIDSLPADDFAGRHALLTESDVCRAALHEESGPALDEATRLWAERAGRKGGHEVDYEARQAAMISRVGPDAGGTG